MATMKITEYASAIGAGALQVPQEPPLTVQSVTFTGTSAPSDALQPGTKFVSIQLDTVGYIQFAPTPVATTLTSYKHAADVVTWHGVNKDMKIAAITA